MNVDDIITRVRRSFGDESAVQIEDDDVIRWINDAQSEILMHNESVLETIETIDLTVDTQEYDFPDDLYVLRSIRVKSSSNNVYKYISSKNLAEFDRHVDGWDGTSFTSNMPYIYTTYQRTIFLFPIPSKTITDGIKLLYQKRPTTIENSTQDLSLPEEYHTAIVKYCMMQANTLDEDYEASAIHQAQFMGDIKVLGNFSRDANETYKTITVLEEDM